MNRMPRPSLHMSRSFNDFANDMEGVMNRLFQTNGDSTTASYTPRLDILETEDRFVVHLDLPGVAAENIQIDIDNDELSVSGHRAAMPKEGGPNPLRSERVWGAFRRSVLLPKAVDRDAIKADYTDGVLTIDLPKVAEVKPRRIEISVGGATASESRGSDPTNDADNA